MAEEGYVNYFDILGVGEGAKPGEVKNAYRRKMKALVVEIAQAEITEQRRAHYLLEMAKLNAALCVLRDTGTRDAYWSERQRLIALEEEWREAADDGRSGVDQLRRDFSRGISDFLTKYVEELMLDAGRDPECVEMSHWDAAHERHAFRILRHYRQRLFQEILDRLPYSEITKPDIDWDKRRATAAGILAAEGGFSLLIIRRPPRKSSIWS